MAEEMVEIDLDLTPEQKALFDRENPYWAEFFKDRK